MSDCKNCPNKGEIYSTMVPLKVLEDTRAQMDLHAQRLVRVIVLLIVLLVASNVAWLWYESQFEELSIEQEVDTGEGDAFVVGNGDLNYGEGQTESNETNP